jgi:hypothetical protein
MWPVRDKCPLSGGGIAKGFTMVDGICAPYKFCSDLSPGVPVYTVKVVENLNYSFI